MRARPLVRLGLLIAIIFIAGCVQLVRTPGTKGTENAFWSGRLSLQVDNAPTQSFAAAFELKGGATAGELALFSPLGSTLAQLSWAPGRATLNADSREQQFGSLDALVAQATGTAIPVAALFDWLAGTPTPVPGWQPDLSRLGAGHLAARRTDPQPLADLRVVLDR